jgi:hypothetical protein
VPWDDLEAPGLALAAYVDLERRSRGDRVMLGVGRTASQLVIQSAGGLWTRHLPLGLRDAEPEAWPSGCATRSMPRSRRRFPPTSTSARRARALGGGRARRAR